MLIAPFDNAQDIFARARELHEPVVFPTDTIYGIGAPVSDIEANTKIYEIKGREKNKPFPILVSSLAQAADLADIDDRSSSFINELWPGPFTFILKAKKDVNSLFTLNGNIAIRMPEVSRLRQLIDSTGALSATSANLSGIDYEPATSKIIDTFQALVKFFIISDCRSAVSSTIIDMTCGTPKIVRGNADIKKIADLVRKYRL